MIFYFSGTGNSKGIAELVAQALGDRAVNCVGAEDVYKRQGMP